jgi:hypothetical protein
VARFVDRQLVAMLDEGAAFRASPEAGTDAGTDGAPGTRPRVAGPVALEHVEIGSNRVQATLVCPSIGPEPATLRFELQSGWLVAGIPAPGWIGRLSAEQREIFEIVLAGFYKLAAVDLVREQLEHALQSRPEVAAPPYDIADEGLVVWPARGFEVEIVYDLHAPSVQPVVRGAGYDGEAIGADEPERGGWVVDLAGRHAMFGREPLYASVWTTTWHQIARGDPPMRIIVGPSLVPGSGSEQTSA